MDLVGSSRNRGERIRDGEPAIVVPVPIDADFFSGRLYDFFDYEFYEIVSASWSSVTDCVAQNYSACAGANCGGVQREYR